MKLVLSLFLTGTLFGSVAMAQGQDGVSQRLFSVLHQIYVQQVDAQFCGSTDRDCEIKVNQLTCLRYGPCQVSYEKADGEIADVTIPRTNGYHLSLYIIVRSAGASGIGQIERFGPRYRPNFRSTTAFSCVGQGDFSSATCL